MKIFTKRVFRKKIVKITFRAPENKKFCGIKVYAFFKNLEIGKALITFNHNFVMFL